MRLLKDKKSGKIKLIFNDFVVRPDKCNFSCQYCLSSEAPKWETKANAIEDNYNEKFLYSEHSVMGLRLNSVIEKFNSIFDATILRISGGEILLVKNIEEFLSKWNNFETIQIITNGYFLTKDRLEKLKVLPNCQLHISLDGNTYKQNRYRVKNEIMHNVLLNNLNLAVSIGIDVEIGSILSDANTGDYIEFIEYLKIFEGKVKAYPLPVRGELRKRFYPDDKDIDKFSNIVERYKYFKEVIPAKAYFEEIMKLLGGKRTLRCNIPRTMIQVFDNGRLTPCPNSWTTELGNLLKDDKETVLKNIKAEKMYDLFLQKKPRIECCHSCFTSLDILNLYLVDKITFEEITDLPLYSGRKTQERLKLFKQMQSP